MGKMDAPTRSPMMAREIRQGRARDAGYRKYKSLRIYSMGLCNISVQFSRGHFVGVEVDGGWTVGGGGVC